MGLEQQGSQAQISTIELHEKLPKASANMA